MPTYTLNRPDNRRHGIKPASAAKLDPHGLSLHDERLAAERAVDLAEREVAAAFMFLDGLRRESCPTNDPAWVGGKLRLHIAGAVALEAAAWLKAVRGRRA